MISTGVEKQVEHLFGSLKRRRIGVRSRESVALSFLVFNDETGCFLCTLYAKLKVFKEPQRDATEDVPAEQSQACQNSWISRTDEDSRGPACTESPAGQGSKARFGEALLSARARAHRQSK